MSPSESLPSQMTETGLFASFGSEDACQVPDYQDALPSKIGLSNKEAVFFLCNLGYDQHLPWMGINDEGAPEVENVGPQDVDGSPSSFS